MTLPRLDESNINDIDYLDLLFFDHPRKEDMTYGQHLVRAGSFSYMFFVASIKCLLHGLVPYLFETCAKDTMAELEMTYYKKQE